MPKDRANKTRIYFMIFILVFLKKIVCNTMQYMIFKYGLEPVLIQRISFGSKALLENLFLKS